MPFPVYGSASGFAQAHVINTRSRVEEGDACRLIPLCMGSIELRQDPCTCAAGNAPCSACEGAWLECTECHERIYPAAG